MEVLVKDKSDSPVLLSNSEVIHLLEDRLKSRDCTNKKPKRNKYKHRDWIENKVVEYLKTTPCISLGKSDIGSFQNTLMKSKKRKSVDTSNEIGFGLTEAEALQVLNFMPKEKVEIHLMVEELHTRMTDERQDELLEYIQSQNIEKGTSQKEDLGDSALSTRSMHQSME